MPPSGFNAKSAIQFAGSAEAFLQAIARSPKNAYILDRYNSRNIERPLKYLMLDEPQIFGADTPQIFFYGQEADGEIIAATKLKPAPNEDNVLWFMGTNVHPEHRQKGLARELIRSALRYASENDYRVGVSRFEEMGLHYLRPLYPRLHAEFPDLEIRYGGGLFTKALTPYIIGENGRDILPASHNSAGLDEHLARDI